MMDNADKIAIAASHLEQEPQYNIGGISQLIEFYEPNDVYQSQLKKTFSAFLENCEYPFSGRHYHPGHLTASAVVLDVPLSNILLVHHCTLKRWVQPGGHVEPQDRTLGETAVRELEEETGILTRANDATLFDLDIHPVMPKGSEPSHLHFDVRFLIVTAEHRIKSESAEANVRWFPINYEYQTIDMDRLIKKCQQLFHRESGAK